VPVCYSLIFRLPIAARSKPHAWETRQLEKAREAAADTVARLERALAEMESELDFRREELGKIVAARHERGARLFEAHQAGARTVFGGSMAPNTAEAAWDGVPASAVQTVATHIAEAGRWDAEETAALCAVSDLERRVHMTQRALNHWQAEAGNPDSPVAVRAPAGPPPESVAERAEAATAQWTAPEPSAAQSPASGSVSLRDRLAGLGARVSGW